MVIALVDSDCIIPFAGCIISVIPLFWSCSIICEIDSSFVSLGTDDGCVKFGFGFSGGTDSCVSFVLLARGLVVVASDETRELLLAGGFVVVAASVKTRDAFDLFLVGRPRPAVALMVVAPDETQDAFVLFLVGRPRSLLIVAAISAVVGADFLGRGFVVVASDETRDAIPAVVGAASDETRDAFNFACSSFSLIKFKIA